MPYRGVQAHASPPDLAERASLWVAAISFEERCVASAIRLCEAGRAPTRGLLLEYPTQVRPVEQDRIRRQRNRQQLDVLVSKGAFGEGLDFVAADPYSYRAAQSVLSDALASAQGASVVLDVSCLTKIHAVALADPSVFALNTTWELAYTLPETYGYLDSTRTGGAGWRDVLFLPIGASAGLTNESDSRGVILAGHEGDRLIVALAEVEPAGGVLITATAPDRPDLRRESTRRNDKVSRLLASRSSGQWVERVIDIREPNVLAEAVEPQTKEAAAADAPVILFPFGPKPFVSLAAMQLAGASLEAWFVYPIPLGYDVDYSYGIGRTLWYSRPRSEPAVQEELLPLDHTADDSTPLAPGC